MPLPGFSAPTPSAPSLPAPFGQIWPNEGPPFDHSPSFGQIWPNEGPLFDQTEPNKGPPLFGPVWPNDAEREGVLGAGESRCQGAGGVPGESQCWGAGRALEEHVPGSGERVLVKEKGDGREGMVLKRGKGTIPKRGDGKEMGPEGRCWGGKEMGATSKEGEEMGAASKGERRWERKGVKRKRKKDSFKFFF